MMQRKYCALILLYAKFCSAQNSQDEIFLTTEGISYHISCVYKLN